MSKTIVVADAHGNIDQVAGLLKSVGALVERESLGLQGEGLERAEGWTTVQLGDLCNCVAGSTVDDGRCLDNAGWFDYYLCGNHEYPYLGGGRFSGFWFDLQLERRFQNLYGAGMILPAVAIEGVLITHAGIAQPWPHRQDSAEQVAARLQEWWFKDPTLPIFNDCGRARGGLAQLGGILWADWSEPKWDGVSQIVGHTVGEGPRGRKYENGNWSLCIDLGGGKGKRIMGAVLENGEVSLVLNEQTVGAVGAVPYYEEQE